jgi:hypothetical protein
LRIKLTNCAFLEKAEKAVKLEKTEKKATAKARKLSTSLTAANSSDKRHQAGDDILVNGAGSHDETKRGVLELAGGGNQDVAMDDHAMEGESEDEEEGEDVICNGFNNYMTTDEEQSAFDVAHLLSGMSQEYIFDLLKFLKVRKLLDLPLSDNALFSVRFSKGHNFFSLN